MPKRTDINKILIIGAGPIVIGQACEFDYSGTQACKALKEEGYKVILINSNPATIMTDPDFADRTYIEPINPDVVEKIIIKERPDALLPTMGGQTALNTAKALAESGVLDKYGVKLIGANLQAINKAEDRELFKEAMQRIGLEMPKSAYVHSFAEAIHAIENIGFPAIIRPSFTLGGTGANIAYNREEFEPMIRYALEASPVGEVLIDESIMGWKEYELEVMRDTRDNVVIICSIENFDPMGVHTGDSITVAPAQTLSDKEYQIMRDASIKIIREIGVDTGGSNVQFGVNPKDGRLVVIEMNPRVSRSSALASKATGFPIAKIAAKLAVGFTLDEIRNDITRETPASFEPTIDYVVVKIPRFTFEKFPAADATLMTQMKSVGEVMSIGRTFKESLQKAIRSLEIGTYGFESKVGVDLVGQASCLSSQAGSLCHQDRDKIIEKLRTPNWERLWYVADALRVGFSIGEIFEITKIDRWFLEQIREIIEFEKDIVGAIHELPLRRAKELGFSDRRLAELTQTNESEIRRLRKESGIEPVFKRVDTCAAEFEAHTPYLYSTYERPFYRIADNSPAFDTPSLSKRGLGGVAECEAKPTDRKKIMILGGGPNRIGQGIEFDYCCVHAAFALKEDGFETIMVNCNPETVSTDYDTSDRLYFEPLTFEDVMNIVEKERPDGVIVQFGGQTPLKLAVPLSNAFEEMKKQGGKEVKIIGTSPASIDIAEDRFKFRKLLQELGLKHPEGFDIIPDRKAFEAGVYGGIEGLAEKIGYPLIVRPSYVLGGRAMAIVYDKDELHNYLKNVYTSLDKDIEIYADRFLNDALEVDVDCISDGETIVVGGIMEHIEEAGIHSGDSACSLPPYSLDKELIDEIERQTKVMAKALNVKGLMNVQFAIKDKTIYVLEVNPRASRTVPFVSKAIGKPLAKLAARVMAAEIEQNKDKKQTLKKLGFTKEIVPAHISVKEAVFPFIKFPGVDTILGPEMKSTGEVMGIDNDFGKAFGKAQQAAGVKLPLDGKVFISVKDSDKRHIIELSKKLHEMEFLIIATKGTSDFLNEYGVTNESISKVTEGIRPNIVDKMKSGDIHLVINTTFGSKSVKDSYEIRRTALTQNIAYYTTIAGAKAAVEAIDALKRETLDVRTIQEYHSYQ